MTTTFIGIIIAAIAIEVDRLTQFKYSSFPLLALAGVMTVVVSLVM